MSTQENLSTSPRNFHSWVKKSIELLGNFGKSMDDGAAINFLVEHDIPKNEATEIVLFLPIAFCRKLLPTVNWQPDYIEEKNNKRSEKSFASNPRYIVIANETSTYWNNNPKKDEIMSVAGRSAEFKAINDLLLKGGRLEDITIGKPIIMY